MTTIRDHGALGRTGTVGTGLVGRAGPTAGAPAGPPVPWRPSRDARRDPPGSSRASCRRWPGSRAGGLRPQ